MLNSNRTFQLNTPSMVNPQSLIHDKVAIPLVNSDLVTFGHILKLMSKLPYFFLKHGAHIVRNYRR